MISPIILGESIDHSNKVFYSEINQAAIKASFQLAPSRILEGPVDLLLTIGSILPHCPRKASLAPSEDVLAQLPRHFIQLASLSGNTPFHVQKHLVQPCFFWPRQMTALGTPRESPHF